MIPKSGYRFSEKIMRKKPIAPETCNAIKAVLRCSRNALVRWI
jgi:hypothetical protein